MFFLYNILFTLVCILGIPLFCVRSLRTQKYQEGFWTRIGWISASAQTQLASKPNIWIHAVSVGEFLAAQPLINALQSTHSDTRIVLTVTTRTAFHLAQKTLPSNIFLMYSPLDFAWTCSRFHRIIQPQKLIIMETELWPNMIRLCKAPVYLVNARLSERSFKRYRYVRRLITPLLAQLQAICAQSPNDAKRFIDLGANPKQLHVSGQIKFDRALQLAQDAKPSENILSLNKDETIILAASTHANEDELILATFQKLLQKHPQLRLILAPRHPERCKQVLTLSQELDPHTQIFSSIKDREDTSWTSQIIIIDTIGDLSRLYQVATMVIIGGSFIPHGGQNPLEPAAFAKPIITGPYMFNFQSILQLLLDAKGIVQVTHQENLLTQSLAWLDHPDQAQIVGDNAQLVLNQHRGATEKILVQIQN